MNTKMQFETMAKALPFAAELLDSTALKDFKDTMRGKKQDDDVSTGEMMQQLLPIFLTEKRDVLFGLFGALIGKTAEEVADQEWSETAQLMRSQILNDLFDFFIFSLRMAKNA